MHASDLFKHFQAFNSAAIMIQELYLKNIFSKYTSLRSEFRNEGFTSLRQSPTYFINTAEQLRL